jgi:hypothetical protein
LWFCKEESIIILGNDIDIIRKKKKGNRASFCLLEVVSLVSGWRDASKDILTELLESQSIIKRNLFGRSI